mmetsp:Transcript_96013/g.271483  ORF Transcript_96013/g.271483 Transcript_96013/m.271483 type:complete len:263 (+) Transcript_96013:1-789(+)
MQRMMRQVTSMHQDMRVTSTAVEEMSAACAEIRCFMLEMRTAMGIEPQRTTLDASSMMDNQPTTFPLCSNPEPLKEQLLHSCLEKTCDLRRNLDEPPVVVWQLPDRGDAAGLSDEALKVLATATETRQAAEPQAFGNVATGPHAKGNAPARPQGTPCVAPHAPGDIGGPATTHRKAYGVQPRSEWAQGGSFAAAHRPAGSRKSARRPAPSARLGAAPGPRSGNPRRQPLDALPSEGPPLSPPPAGRARTGSGAPVRSQAQVD